MSPHNAAWLSPSGAFSGAAKIVAMNPNFWGSVGLSAIPLGSVILADLYVSALEPHAPEAPAQSTSWWRSIAQAVGAGGVGVGGADLTGL